MGVQNRPSAPRKSELHVQAPRLCQGYFSGSFFSVGGGGRFGLSCRSAADGNLACAEYRYLNHLYLNVFLAFRALLCTGRLSLVVNTTY